MKHCMVDLETWGLRPGCAIASIGAQCFDVDSGELGNSFYASIKLESCLNAGLTLEADTVLWWMQQSDPARKALLENTEVLTSALGRFNIFWQENDCVHYWCNGAGFDEPLHTAALNAVHFTVLWKYWAIRDTRTIYELADIKPDRSAGVHHNALDDAKTQARAVIDSYKIIRARYNRET